MKAKQKAEVKVAPLTEKQKEEIMPIVLEHGVAATSTCVRKLAKKYTIQGGWRQRVAPFVKQVVESRKAVNGKFSNALEQEFQKANLWGKYEIQKP